MIHPELKKRIITATGLVAGYVAIVLAARYFNFVRILIPMIATMLVFLGALESYQMIKRSMKEGGESSAFSARIFHLISHLFPLLAISVLCVGTLIVQGYTSWLILALTQSFLALTGITLLLIYPMFDHDLTLGERGQYLSLNLSSFLLIVAGGGSLIALCSGPHAGVFLGFLLIVVCASDIVAYFAGRAIGEEKLSPVVSPNKTKAGGYAGVLLGGIAGALTWSLFPLMPVPLLYAFIVSSLLAIVSQIGDLLQSYVKRTAGVKDSGTFFPGHGGVLDRLDGILFAAPFYLCTLAFFEFYEHLPPHF